MGSFLKIAKLTCRMIIRSHIFQGLLLLLIASVILLSVTVSGDGTARAQIQISLKYSLAAAGFILSLSTIWISCFTMSHDIDSYQIHMVITKPVNRVVVWLGKAAGILFIHTILLIFASLLVYILVLCQFQDQMFLRYTLLPIKILIAISGLITAGVLAKIFLKLAKKNNDTDGGISSFIWKTLLFSVGALLISISIHAALERQFRRDTFSTIEKVHIQNEVLVGRRVYRPIIPDINKLVRKEYQRRLSALPADKRKTEAWKKADNMNAIRSEITSRLGEVQPGGAIYWSFQGIKRNRNVPIFLRFRVYVGEISTKKQRLTNGIWGARLILEKNKNTGKNGQASNEKIKVFSSMTDSPQQIMSGVFNENVLPPSIVAKDGTAVIGYTNLDPQRKAVYFQISESPKLLVKVSGFAENYARAVFMIFLKILFLTVLACSAGGIASAPVAIFMVIAYSMIGFFSTYLINLDKKQQLIGGPISPDFFDKLGSILSNILILFIIPMQNFEVSNSLSNGELIEWSTIGSVILYNLLMRGMPLALIGIWLYTKRELGLVIKK